MFNWQLVLKYDPLDVLISTENEPVAFFAARDLLGQVEKSPKVLWDLPDVKKIVKKQQDDGSWKYPAGNTKIRSFENYNQIETYRNLGYLVEIYGFNTTSPVITKAADFLFSFQTNEGDIRGILGNQYTPYYTAGIVELLIKAGYSGYSHIEKTFEWLNLIRQNDGGWAIPLRTHDEKLDIIAMNTKTLEPVRSRPFSHLVTGVVLRAYAAHNTYRNSVQAHEAAKLLLSKLFKKDSYPDRCSSDFWLKFTFPFWFTDLISAMDSLSLLGFSHDNPQIERAVQWFVSNQQPTGLWTLRTMKNKKLDADLWLSLAICRILRRIYG